MHKLYLSGRVLSCMFCQSDLSFSLLLFQPFFDKLIKRKWLTSTDAFEAIETSIKQHFKKFRRMDPPPYQVTVTWSTCEPLCLVDWQLKNAVLMTI